MPSAETNTFSDLSITGAINVSVVSTRLAILTAFVSAVFVTLAGSITPLSMRHSFLVDSKKRYRSNAPCVDSLSKPVAGGGKSSTSQRKQSAIAGQAMPTGHLQMPWHAEAFGNGSKNRHDVIHPNPITLVLQPESPLQCVA